MYKDPSHGDYEKVLADMDVQIHNLEMKISEIGLKQRAATSALLFYTLPVWFSFVVFYFVYSHSADASWEIKFLKISCLVLGPIL